MSCPELLRTQAWFDGELPGSEAAAAEQHAAGCPECRLALAEGAAVRDAVRSRATRWRAPLAFRARITATLDNEVRRTRRIGLSNRSFWIGAATGTGLTAVAAAIALLLIVPIALTSIPDAVVRAHTDALMAHRTIEVVSGNHHTVKPWFAGRVDVSPPVADFSASGFVLAGGRVDRIAGMPSAVVVYSHGAHEIDLFVWADHGAAMPREAVRHGYRARFWKSGDLDFAAVSDIENTELQKFVRLVQSER